MKRFRVLKFASAIAALTVCTFLSAAAVFASPASTITSPTYTNVSSTPVRHAKFLFNLPTTVDPSMYPHDLYTPDGIFTYKGAYNVSVDPTIDSTASDPNETVGRIYTSYWYEEVNPDPNYYSDGAAKGTLVFNMNGKFLFGTDNSGAKWVDRPNLDYYAPWAFDQARTCVGPNHDFYESLGLEFGSNDTWIGCYGPDGTLKFSSPSATNYNFYPLGIAVDTDGKLYAGAPHSITNYYIRVLDSTLNQVQDIGDAATVSADPRYPALIGDYLFTADNNVAYQGTTSNINEIGKGDGTLIRRIVVPHAWNGFVGGLTSLDGNLLWGNGIIPGIQVYDLTAGKVIYNISNEWGNGPLDRLPSDIAAWRGADNKARLCIVDNSRGPAVYEITDTYSDVDNNYAPVNCVIVQGGTCDISGTASGATKVEVSTDGGVTWKGAADGVTDTSGDGSWSSWSYVWQLPADGSYKIASRATDNMGAVETPVSWRTVRVCNNGPDGSISFVNPQSGSLLPFTNSAPVSLLLSATDHGTGVGVMMQFSNDELSWSDWETFTTSKAWTLTPGDEVKTVYARFKDSLGHISQYSGTITMETTPPSSAITSPISGATLTGVNTTISGTASDGAGSGVRKVEVSTDGGATWKGPKQGVTDTSGNGSWSSWSLSWTPSVAGSCSIKSRATDVAGNVETPGTGNTVTVIMQQPIITITDPSSTVTPNTQTYTVKFAGTAAGSTARVDLYYEFSNWGHVLFSTQVVPVQNGAFSGTATFDMVGNWPNFLLPGSYELMAVVVDNFNQLSRCTVSNAINIASVANNYTSPMVAKWGLTTEDYDGDGITNYDEIYYYETDPGNVDTDGGGVADLVESCMGTSPGTYPTNSNDDFNSTPTMEGIFYDISPQLGRKAWFVVSNSGDKIYCTASLFSSGGALIGTKHFSIPAWGKTIINPADFPGVYPSVVAGDDGKKYCCILSHTADATNRPVTGINAATYWAVVPDPAVQGASWTGGAGYSAGYVKGSLEVRTSYGSCNGLTVQEQWNPANPTALEYSYSSELLTPSASDTTIYGPYWIDNAANWETSYVIKNVSSNPLNLEATFYSVNGSVITTATKAPLAAKNVWTFRPSDFLDASANPKGSVVVRVTSGNGKISGYAAAVHMNAIDPTVFDLGYCSVMGTQNDLMAYTSSAQWSVEANKSETYFILNNPGTSPSTVALNFYDANGAMVATRTFPIQPNELSAISPRYLSEIGWTIPHGSIEMSVTSGPSVLGLNAERLSNTYTPTVFDVCIAENLKTPGRYCSSLSAPYLRNGYDGYYGQVVLKNVYETSINAYLYFYDMAGNLIATDIKAIPGKSSVVIKTQDYSFNATECSLRISGQFKSGYTLTGYFTNIRNDLANPNPDGSAKYEGSIGGSLIR